MDNGVADQNSRPSGNPEDEIALIKNNLSVLDFSAKMDFSENFQVSSWRG
jgi:hypothetical protein